MNTRACLLCILLVVSFSAFALAQITIDQAAEIAADYKDPTESLDMQPQLQVLSGADSYWVVEILSFGKIITMIPIDAETGEVHDEIGMVEIVKTHYLANFFATHSEVEDFLDDTKNLALGMKSDFETRKNQFVSLWEPQIPENVTLTTMDPYLSALDVAVTRAENVRLSVNNLKPILASIQSPSDVSVVQAGFSSMFLKESSFISSLGGLNDKATAFITEINENMQAGEIDQSLGGALVQAVSMPTLVQDKNRLEDDLDQNQNIINAFFAGIDTQAEQYLLRLQNRTSGSDLEQLRKSVAEKLANYSDEFNDITNNVNSIPPKYDDEIDDLEDLLEQAQDLYVDGDYTSAQDMFSDIESKISTLKAQIGKWPPTCASGKIWSGSQCVCPSGTEEQSDGTCAAPGGGGINWMLIIGLVAVLGALVAYKKFKGGGEEVEEETGSYLESYKF